MAERAAAYVRACPAAAAAAIAAAREARLLLVARPGPSAFVVREQRRRKSFKVLLGNPVRCACGSQPPCIHVAWVLTRVLRLPETSELLWQHALVDRELQEVLRCACTGRRRTRERKPSRENSTERQPRP